MAEFLTSHYCINLMWCSTSFGCGAGSVAKKTEAICNRFQNLVTNPEWNFRSEAVHVVSKRNTSKFGQAFLRTATAVPTKGHKQLMRPPVTQQALIADSDVPTKACAMEFDFGCPGCYLSHGMVSSRDAFLY